VVIVTVSLTVLGAVLAVAFAIGVRWQRGYGKLHTAGADRVTEADLGSPLGSRATLVQFSSAFCAPCRASRRVLSDVAGMIDGVTYVEVDAESRLGLVRRLNILRTPTVLVIDPAGRIRRRASGQPRKADVIAAIGEVIPDAGPDREPDRSARPERIPAAGRDSRPRHA
jgi:thiol-disulfide isomerase/thioredoxin